MTSRTDLAVESFPDEELPEGIKRRERGGFFRITEITIESAAAAEALGKSRGVYITLEGRRLGSFAEDYEEAARELAEELRRLVPEGDVLVTGLGNSDVTPDSLGPKTAAKILATRRLREELAEEELFAALRPVSSIAGGVLGQTGIETAELIKAVAGAVKPAGIIVVDALACSDISRLGTTIQIADSGISPGSGVFNRRKELSAKTLGVPVIAIGVPTVVDVHTIVRNATGIEAEEDFPNMIVTPNDADRLTERAAQLIAFGINLALQPTLSFSDVRGLF